MAETSWITLAQARAGAGTTASTNAAAKLIATWLDGLDSGVPLSKSSPTDILFSRDGISLVQKYSREVTEYRALAEDLADFLKEYLPEDSTKEWTMFGITAQGEVHVATATYGPASNSTSRLSYYKGETGSSYTTTGSFTYPDYSTGGVRVEAESYRANEADGWRVRVTKTTFFAPNYSFWNRAYNKSFIPAPPTTDGVVVSSSKVKQFLGPNCYQNINTTVTEYRFLTASEAASKIAALAASGSRVYAESIPISWSSTGGTTYMTVQVRGGTSGSTSVGTDVQATSRPDGNGYFTVTATAISYNGSTS